MEINEIIRQYVVERLKASGCRLKYEFAAGFEALMLKRDVPFFHMFDFTPSSLTKNIRRLMAEAADKEMPIEEDDETTLPEQMREDVPQLYSYLTNRDWVGRGPSITKIIMNKKMMELLEFGEEDLIFYSLRNGLFQ